ncbi:response regulator transcription factor [Streptomyces sp. NPDC046870]|uniref:helix-turn-helix transcriptional regulator n=1 Tax=Streptomyces sp. NPDC046870 TaxID=3155135 RepID=UPI003451FA06
MAAADHMLTGVSDRTQLMSVPDIDTTWRTGPAMTRRADAAPRSAPLRVTIRASDMLTADGAQAWLEAVAGVQVVSWAERQHAHAAVILAHEVTVQVLSSIDEASKSPGGGSLPVVLVTDTLNERQLFAAVDRGTVGVLLRPEVTYPDVVDAVRQCLNGASAMPAPMVRSLIERLQSLRAKPHPQTWPFTPREVDVLRHMAEGMSTAEVADRLNYSERTIKNILHEIVLRLNLRNRTHAVAYAIRSGVV